MNAQPASPASFDVLAIVTSAGGLEAMSAVLADLPASLSAAVIVGQHLGAESALPEILSRRTHLVAEWARDGQSLQPGRIHVVPRNMRMEVLPDRTVALTQLQREVLLEKPLDALLTSVAESCGSRALALVLTGMGRDGAAGARKVKDAGGAVLVESEGTAAYPEMPRAAIELGAANLVLPLRELGKTLADLMRGGRFPLPRNEAEASEALFAGAGEARAALRGVDWTGTAVGSVLHWPGTLKSIVASILNAQFPMCVLWSDEFVQIYNDAWISVIGQRHPEAAGLPARATWQEHWPVAVQHFRNVAETGKTTMTQDWRADTDRRGFLEEAWFTTSISAIADDHGSTGGLLLVAAERTASVLAERRLQTLRRLAALSAEQVSAGCQRAAAVLEENPQDVPFALLYVLDAAGLRADLCGCAGLREGSPPAPRSIDLVVGDDSWPLGRVVRQRQAVVLEDLAGCLRGVFSPAWDAPPRSAMLLPLQVARGDTGAVLVLGLSRRLALDEAYRSFLEAVALQVATNLGEAQLREREHARLEQLALLDRSRTEFFSNVSHEFRTPLTLILGPLEDLLAEPEPAVVSLRRELEVAARNARRLLNLVDALLDFSRIEAGRLRARFEAADLSALTTDITSLFRSACERAGLALEVECAPAPRPVAVDAGMWEQIVSNLLSNALKFTFRGRIAVRVDYLPQHVQLVVSDTGVGIPLDEQANVFRRFHRVREARGRTDEGVGIGLAIVAELVGLHHGRIRVRSAPGEGSTFTVWISSDLQQRTLPLALAPPAGRSVAVQLAREASAWVQPEPERLPPGVIESMIGPAGTALPAQAEGSRVLVADDNADMRAYLGRILGAFWSVEVASDGVDALARARRQRPDLVLADVMMPGLDGFGLLRELRADNELKAIPVLLLTARAHEEAAIEGLLAGADDYVAKPFSSRELVARIGAQLALARVRRRGEQELRELLAIVPVGVYACDLAGDFSFWNQRAVELWGGEPLHEARDWALLGAPKALAADGVRLRPDQSPMAQVLRTGVGVEDQEVTVVRADGGRLDLIVNICPLREDGRLVGAVCAFLDVTARKLAERQLQTLNEELEARVGQRTSELQATQRAQAYLLRLADTLRSLSDPRAIQAAASRLLGEQLGVARVYYAEMDDETWVVTDPYDSSTEASAPAGSDPAPALVGWIPDSSPAKGRVVVEDTRTDPRIAPAQRGALLESHAVSWVGVPLVKDGRVLAALLATTAAPRRWTAAEIGLVEGTAERTWAAVERARTAAALRTRNKELETFSSVTAGRELRMIELKEEVNALRRRLGEPQKYPLESDRQGGAP